MKRCAWEGGKGGREDESGKQRVSKCGWRQTERRVLRPAQFWQKHLFSGGRGDEAGRVFTSGTSNLPCGAGRPVPVPIGWGLTLTVVAGVFFFWRERCLTHTFCPTPLPLLLSSWGELHCGITSCPNLQKWLKWAEQVFASYSLKTRLKINYKDLPFN